MAKTIAHELAVGVLSVRRYLLERGENLEDWVFRINYSELLHLRDGGWVGQDVQPRTLWGVPLAVVYGS